MKKGGDVIDTCVLILGMKHARGEKSEGNQAERAFEYLKSLEDKKLPAIVPSVVVAELLTRMEREQAEEVWAYLDNNFIVAPFDGRAALLGASAMRAALDGRKGGEGGDPPSRHEAKVDGMIVGVAMAREAERIVSYNLAHFKKAHCPLPVHEPPQLSLVKPIDFDGLTN